jgi:hypothetical protein
MKSSSLPAYITVAVVLSGVVLWGGLRVIKMIQPATQSAAMEDVAAQVNAVEVDRLSGKELAREIKLWSLRENSTLPSMVSPYIKQVRTYYSPSENQVEFTYQVMNAERFKGVLSALPDVISDTYCKSERLSLIRTHLIPAKWLYLSGGQVLHEQIVSDC